MGRTAYINAEAISVLEHDIMVVVQAWAKGHRTPIPQKQIVSEMVAVGIKPGTVTDAVKSLVVKGYIRKAVMGVTSKLKSVNKALYVQIRRV